MPTTDVHPDSARVHPLRRMHAWLLAASLLAALATAFAQPLPILETRSWMCPGATLPLRVAALQPPGNPVIDPHAWIAQDEFRTAQASLWLGQDAPAIYLVVLAYLAGSPVDVELLLTPFGASEPSWRATITPDTPAQLRGSMNLWPSYLVLELPRSEWRHAFPSDGPYRLEARPASDPHGGFVEGFCAAETSSWVFVLWP